MPEDIRAEIKKFRDERVEGEEGQEPNNVIIYI